MKNTRSERAICHVCAPKRQHHEQKCQYQEQYNQQLFDACETGQYEKVVTLFRDHCVDIDARDVLYGSTALHKASRFGQKKIVEFLIDVGADIDAKEANNHGWSSLHWAGNKGHKDVVELLIMRGANIESINNDMGQTPLLSSCFYGKGDLVLMLLKNGANANATDRNGQTVLDIARGREHVEIEFFLRGYMNGKNIPLQGVDDSNTNSSLQSNSKIELFEACKNGEYSIVEELLEAGVYVNTMGNEGGTPLHFLCCHSGDRDIAKLLLDKGANVNAKTNSGVTPLHVAVFHGGDQDVVKLLLNRGADLEAKDNEGYTPLHYAGKKLAIVRILLERGAKKDIITEMLLEEDKDRHDDILAISDMAIGTLTVGRLYRGTSIAKDMAASRNRRLSASQLVSTVSKLRVHEENKSQIVTQTQLTPDPSSTKFDVFLSHNWGSDEEGRDNHARVGMINKALKERGLRTWFDEHNMLRNIADDMIRGIDESTATIVFVTSLYMVKVAGKGENGCGDNCKKEFEYSELKKTASHMIPVVMEKSCINPRNWEGQVCAVLGSRLYCSFFKEDQLESCIDDIVKKIQHL